MKLDPNKKLDIEEVLKDLDKYRPRRKGCLLYTSDAADED